MNMPEAFTTMCSKLGQDTPKPRFTSVDVFFTYLLSDFTAKELGEIASFMSGLLRNGLNDAQLMRIWRGEGSDFCVTRESEGDVAEFFRMILNAIEDKRRAT